MNTIVKGICSTPQIIISRSLSCSSALYLKQWRIEQGLSANRTAEGILTDGPDYTFLDGRPTPLLQKQKKRMLKHQEYASKIVTLCSELDFAKQRHQNMLKAKEDERKAIISNRLKPKGKALLKK
ncbi:39S ribosomal protein L52, mitochondrial isoform X2 [Melitaea cinxia]|uniref:39S ribosomal protein L52, mitochondrial isoform X2 n=1 Tax=Melitaea cinxia TaxID=113334 RepID=UPI001E2735F6|nr:39S ribosomal protein L52, mitochondrial isoform X2 [Melitaea cinxia]